MSAALQHELAADGAQVGQLTGVDPDIERQHGGSDAMISSATSPCAAG